MRMEKNMSEDAQWTPQEEELLKDTFERVMKRMQEAMANADSISDEDDVGLPRIFNGHS